ncbi:hypothetical protein ACLMJK_004804 [Lecanora helva]
MTVSYSGHGHPFYSLLSSHICQTSDEHPLNLAAPTGDSFSDVRGRDLVEDPEASSDEDSSAAGENSPDKVSTRRGPHLPPTLPWW